MAQFDAVAEANGLQELPGERPDMGDCKPAVLVALHERVQVPAQVLEHEEHVLAVMVPGREPRQEAHAQAGPVHIGVRDFLQDLDLDAGRIEVPIHRADGLDRDPSPVALVVDAF